MTALNYVTITETFTDGSNTSQSGYVRFTPSQSVYAGGQAIVTVENPITVQVTNGVLGTVELLATDNAGLTFLSLTGFFWWSVEIVIGGVEQPGFSFVLPSSPSPRELFSLADTGPTGAGVVSVFGRTGAVVGQSGDYTATQVGADTAGAAAAAQTAAETYAVAQAAAAQANAEAFTSAGFVPNSAVGAASGVAGLDANERLLPANRDMVSASVYTNSSMPGSLTSGTVYRFDCTSASASVPLPSAPALGTAIGFQRIDTVAANNLTITPGSGDSMAAGTPTVAGGGQSLIYIYGPSRAWYVFNGALPIADLLDAITAAGLFAPIGLPLYQGGVNYPSGYQVINNGVVYYATNAITNSPVTFNPAQWTLVGPVSGAYLCAPSVYAPTGASPTLLNASSTGWTAFAGCSTNTFTAPASGEVVVTASFVASSSAASNLPSVLLSAHGNTSVLYGYAQQIQFSSPNFGDVVTVKFVVSGLVAGNTYQFDLVGACGSTSSSGGTWTVNAWGTQTAPTLSDTNKWGGPVTMEVQAV